MKEYREGILKDWNLDINEFGREKKLALAILIF